jgi:iron complex outermembrane recepter protein
MTPEVLRRALPLLGAVLLLLKGPLAEAAQEPPGEVSGRLVNAVTLAPVANATVRLEELNQRARSDPDGTFRFDKVPVGSYHLLVSAPGFVPHRSEINAPTNEDQPEIALAPQLHYSEVVSVSPLGRDQFDAYQATTVLAGQDLAIHLEGSLGATLREQPGLAERSLGPAPSRPVIRGLDGDRVLILEDGQRMGDISSQSGDHGVNVNPAAATRLEVVRGPATLLYGANAIGGLINVITNDIPRRPVTGTTGAAQLDVGSATEEAGGAFDLQVGNGRWAMSAGGSGRRTGDVATPLGELENSHSRGAFGNLGVSWTADHGFLGGGYSYDDTRYGIPVVEDGEVELTPRRHAFNVRGERLEMGGPIESVRGTLGIRRYRHDELVAGDVETEFRNNTVELALLANHRQVGRLTGTVGAWAMGRAFAAAGDEVLSPPIDQGGFALFVYEEITWPHVTLQFGGRYDRASFRPDGGLPERSFDNLSGSLGLLVRPTEQTTIAVSVARAARNPALEELYFFGPHHGNVAFEIGNAALESEKALGADVSFRWRLPRVSGEVTYFRNDIRDYIFRNPISEHDFEERFGHLLDARGHGDHHHDEDELPFIEFVGADSLLQGLELHGDIHLTRNLVAEIGMDYVRGQLRATSAPLPRIPPFRFLGGLRYQQGAVQVGGQLTSAASQERVFGEETPTEGYNLVKLFGSYTFLAGGVASTITARLDNATNELYRNHLSLIKDLAPEMGRSFRLVYSVRF